MAHARSVLGGPAGLLVVGLAALNLLGSYQGYVIAVWAVYGLAAVGLSFVAGWVGEISVGHAAILAVAAYAVTTLHVTDAILALLVGAAFGTLAGALLGLPSLRLRGFGLAIITLVLGEIVRIGISATPRLGESFGVTVPVPALFGVPMRLPAIATASVVLLAASMVLATLLRGSTFGRACRAVRNNEALARAFGCRAGRLRVAAFALGGLYCGIAGVLLSWLTGYIAPDTFNLTLSIYMLAMVVVGGRDELYGPLVGAALFVAVAEVLRVAQELQAVAFGLALLAVALFLPGGVVAVLAERVRRRARARTRLLAGA